MESPRATASTRKCAAKARRQLGAANAFGASLCRQTPNTKQSLSSNDARTGMPHGIPRGAMCVQRFDDSLDSAIHTTYRISLRSSSMPEPRDPLLKVVNDLWFIRTLYCKMQKGFR
jgi:hypothetical protein